MNNQWIVTVCSFIRHLCSLTKVTERLWDGFLQVYVDVPTQLLFISKLWVQFLCSLPGLLVSLRNECFTTWQKVFERSRYHTVYICLCRNTQCSNWQVSSSLNSRMQGSLSAINKIVHCSIQDSKWFEELDPPWTHANLPYTPMWIYSYTPEVQEAETTPNTCEFNFMCL